MSLDPGDHTLSSLLSVLNDNDLKPGFSITSVTNARAIYLLRKLLSRDDYISVAEKLTRASDVMDLLEFTLHVLRHRYLSSSDAPININQRARRFMFKIVSRTPVMLRSFIVTGVSMPKKLDCIGFGGYSNVFKGDFRGTAVALKMLRKNDANNLAFCREALMWGSLKHNYVLPFVGIHEEGGMTFLVSPYMKSGTLAQWRKSTNPSIAQIMERILEVAQGMEYIHSEDVVHGDLRGENVLLDDDFHVQIADFGLTRLLDATRTRSGAKHPNFAAPELFGCLEDASADVPERTQMSDVYAFGCIYYEIHYGRIPFAGKLEIQIMSLVIIQDNRPPRLDLPPLDDELWRLIQQCWMKEPSKRPIMKDITERMMDIAQSVFPPTSTQNDERCLYDLIDEAKPLTLPPEVPDLTNDVDVRVGHCYAVDDTIIGSKNDVRFCILNTPKGPSQVAVKKLRPVSITKAKLVERFIREVNVRYKLQKDGVHPYITELLGIVLENGRPGIVLRHYENGDALSFIQKENFSESKKGEIVSNIAKGLEHIHVHCNAIHGGMGLRNIFFDSRGLPKISGFHLSQIMDTSGFTTRTMSLTVSYTAPEILEKVFTDNDPDDGSEKTSTLISKEADIYAFAILTAEIFMEKNYSVALNSSWLTYQRIMENKRPPEEKVNSQKYFPLLEHCWQTNPAERLHIAQIVSALALINQDGGYDRGRLN